MIQFIAGCIVGAVVAVFAIALFCAADEEGGCDDV